MAHSLMKDIQDFCRCPSRTRGRSTRQSLDSNPLASSRHSTPRGRRRPYGLTPVGREVAGSVAQLPGTTSFEEGQRARFVPRTLTEQPLWPDRDQGNCDGVRDSDTGCCGRSLGRGRDR